MAPKRELLFVPAGGAKGIATLAFLLAGRGEELPIVLLDSDTIGRSAAKTLRDGLYKGQEGRVLLVGDLIGLENAEIEDLVPTEILARIVARGVLRSASDDFDDVALDGSPILPQIEDFATKYEVVLAVGWKVGVASLTKTKLLSGTTPKAETIERWKAVFEPIVA